MNGNQLREIKLCAACGRQHCLNWEAHRERGYVIVYQIVPKVHHWNVSEMASSLPAKEVRV